MHNPLFLHWVLNIANGHISTKDCFSVVVIYMPFAEHTTDVKWPICHNCTMNVVHISSVCNLKPRQLKLSYRWPEAEKYTEDKSEESFFIHKKDLTLISICTHIIFYFAHITIFLK